MTDTTNLADAVRDRVTAGNPPRTHQSPGWRRWTDVLMHRWPTALGIAVAAFTAYDLDLTEGIDVLSPLLVIMALVYVGAVVLNRRGSAWVVLLAAFPTLMVLDAGVVAAVVLLIAALIFLVLGLIRGQVQRPSGLLQTAGMLGFGGIALTALSIDPDLAKYLLAAGIVSHGVWDAIHYWRDRVVARSYAEFCAVMDLIVGAALLFMT